MARVTVAGTDPADWLVTHSAVRQSQAEKLEGRWCDNPADEIATPSAGVPVGAFRCPIDAAHSRTAGSAVREIWVVKLNQSDKKYASSTCSAWPRRARVRSTSSTFFSTRRPWEK